jgi:hypothetical protein
MMYENFHASIQALVSNIASDAYVDLPRNNHAQFEIIDFDAIHEENSIVTKPDLLGIAEFGLEEDEGNHIAQFQIGVSTIDDLNLFRMRKIISVFYERMRVNATFPLVHHETGVNLGLMKVMNGTSVFPLVRTHLRHYRFIQVRMSHALQQP